MNTESIYFCNYSIGEHAYDNVTNVCARYGKRILLFGGVKALCAGKARLEAAIEGSEYAIVDIVLFEQECTYEKIHRLAQRAKEVQADMIFGMGGGTALDTAKGAGSVSAGGNGRYDRKIFRMSFCRSSGSTDIQFSTWP